MPITADRIPKRSTVHSVGTLIQLSDWCIKYEPLDRAFRLRSRALCKHSSQELTYVCVCELHHWNTIKNSEKNTFEVLFLKWERLTEVMEN